jgi:hypothetical protein
MIALILSVALSLGIDGELAVSLALIENSRLDPEAVSKVNANGTVDVGLFQLNSAYIGMFERAYWDKPEPFNWRDPEHNTYVALKHLRYLLRVPQWNAWQALIAWNAGETALMSGKPPEASIVFANRVFLLMQERRGELRDERRGAALPQPDFSFGDGEVQP